MQQKSLLLIGTVVTAAAVCAQAQTQPPATQPSGWEAALKEVAEACKGETPKLCPGLTADTALTCLQTNVDKLAPACKDAVVKVAKAALSF